MNSFRQAAIDFTVPPVRMAVSEVECVNSRGEDDILLMIRVDPGERIHEIKTGECYLRVGDETKKLSYPQRKELEFDKGQAQYDGFPCPGVAMDDLDELFLADYTQSIGASSIDSLLQARNLFTRSSEITNAAYLLFGHHPQDVFPQAHVRVIRFLAADRGTGTRLSVEEGTDLRVEGPIPRCITEATAIIDDLIPRRRHLTSSGRFEATSIIPRDAWLEGLVNAIIHRSYSMAGDHIRVEIFPNRIEIESPGRFPGLPSLARPSQITRFARNPRIARICADLRIGQELGEGIKRIFDEMKFGGLAEPIYKQTSTSRNIESMRVLVVEDEPYMAEAIRDGLRLEAIAADIAGDGDTALELLSVNAYDIAVLDRDIPGPSGDEIAERIVASGSGMPILMLTAADRLDDKASGFGLGADDYLTKPFELRELVLRLRALDRRRAHSRPPVREIAGLRLDPFRREVYRDGRYVALTRKQFAVLEVLVAAEGGVVSAEELLERAWDENADPFTNAVRITVSALRKRLGEPWIIATVAGVGYRIDAGPDTGREGGDRG